MDKFSILFITFLLTCGCFIYLVWLARKAQKIYKSFSILCFSIGFSTLIGAIFKDTSLYVSILRFSSIPISIACFYFGHTIFNFKKYLLVGYIFIGIILVTTFLSIPFSIIERYANLPRLLFAITFFIIATKIFIEEKMYINKHFILLYISHFSLIISVFFMCSNLEKNANSSIFILFPILGTNVFTALYLFTNVNIEYKELQSLKSTLESKVTDRTKELTEANAQLKQLDSLKNDFIANITHDFRSPLTVILNISDLFLKSNKKDKNRQDFELMYKSSLKLKDTIDRLLELAKLEAQGIKLNVQEINIVSFLDNIVNYYQAALSRSKIKIIKKNMGTAADDFFNDPEKLEEIINNIISNAIKFVDKETGVIEIELKDYNDTIEIIITDNGIGIPREKLTAIFNRFEQLEGGSKYHGTGIGLAFSMQLAGRMSGQIRAESEGRGKGSKFFVKLKKGVEHFGEKDFTNEVNQKTNKTHDNKKELLAFDIQKKLAKEETIVHLDNLQGENEYDYKKAKILIVDDDDAINRITFNYLQNNGYSNFIISNTGNLGLEAVYKYKPDLIICDYNMPDIKGSELHDEISLMPEFKLIPFIFLSAVADKDLIIERREHGALAYLKKPIDEKDLILTVDLHLKRYFEFLRIMKSGYGD